LWSQTHTHTDRQTNAGENTFPRFRGDNYNFTIQSDRYLPLSGLQLRAFHYLAGTITKKYAAVYTAKSSINPQ